MATTIKRMKNAGRDVSQSEVTSMAKDSKTQLLKRLRVGGESMPPPNLNDAEMRSLIPYLEQLSGVTGAERNQVAVTESTYRVGEHIVKSTCHVCHGRDWPQPQSPTNFGRSHSPALNSDDKVRPRRFCAKSNLRSADYYGLAANALSWKDASFHLFNPGRSRRSLHVSIDVSPAKLMGSRIRFRGAIRSSEKLSQCRLQVPGSRVRALQLHRPR